MIAVQEKLCFITVLIGVILCSLPPIANRLFELDGIPMLDMSPFIYYSIVSSLSASSILILDLSWDSVIGHDNQKIKYLFVWIILLTSIVPTLIFMYFAINNSTTDIIVSIFCTRIIVLFYCMVSLLEHYDSKVWSPTSKWLIIASLTFSIVLISFESVLISFKYLLTIFIVMRHFFQGSSFVFLLYCNYDIFPLILNSSKKQNPFIFKKYCHLIQLISILILVIYIWTMEAIYLYQPWIDRNQNFFISLSYVLLYISCGIVYLDGRESRRENLVSEVRKYFLYT